MPHKQDLCLVRKTNAADADGGLHNVGLQYHEKKRRLRELESPYKSPQITGIPSGSGPGDPTGRNAERASVLSGDIELIERTAAAAAGKDALWLLKNVTQGIAWEYMPVSCGRRKFYNRRRVFFYLLAQSKGYV